MSYTNTDLENIEKAISDMAMGKRIGSFTHNGRQVRYADITLTELQALRQTVLASVRPMRPRRTLIVTTKGV